MGARTVSEYYGTVQGSAGPGTRQGNKTSGIHAAAQSYSGSVAVDIDKVNREDFVAITVDEGSTNRPRRVLWRGPLADLVNLADHLLLIARMDPGDEI